MQVRRGLQNTSPRQLERARALAEQPPAKAVNEATTTQAPAAPAPLHGDRFVPSANSGDWQANVARAGRDNASAPTTTSTPANAANAASTSAPGTERSEEDAIAQMEARKMEVLLAAPADNTRRFNPGDRVDEGPKRPNLVNYFTRKDAGTEPGQGRLLWTDRSAKQTAAYGEEKGVITAEKKAAADKDAEAILGIQEGDDLEGPPRDFDVGDFAQAAAQRVPSDRLDAASVANAAKYVLGAKTLGEQKERIATTLNALETLDKAGRPPMTNAEKSHDIGFANPGLKDADITEQVLRDHYDVVAAVTGVPGKHELQLDAKRTLIIENDDKGELVHAELKVKKDSFLKQVVGIAVTALSIIPNPLQPIARVANAVMSAANAAKSGNLLGAVASGLGAVAGIASAVGGAAASAAANGLQRVSNVLNRVNQVATGIRNGDVGAVISGTAGFVAGVAGNASEGFANAANRLDNVGQVLSGVRNRDLGQALGGAAGLARNAGNGALADRLDTVGAIAGTGQALAAGDLNGAAANLSGLVARNMERRRIAEEEARRRAEAVAMGPPELLPAGDPNSPDFVGPPEALAGADTTYAVAAGDTLSAIAARNGTTVDALLAANPQITDPNRIRAGDQIVIPRAPTANDYLRSFNDDFLSLYGTASDVQALRIAATARELRGYKQSLHLAESEIATLERRQRAGTLGPGERVRLDALRAQRNTLRSLANNARQQLNAMETAARTLQGISIASDVLSAATTDQQSSTAGRVANAAGNIGVGFGLGAALRGNPALAITDSAVGLVESGVSGVGRLFFGVDPLEGIGTFTISGNLSGAVNNITGGIDALINADAATMRAIREANLRGDNGVVFRGYGLAGEMVADSRVLDPVFSGINYVQDGVASSGVLDPFFAGLDYILGLGDSRRRGNGG